MDDWNDPLAVWDGRPTDDAFPTEYDGRDGSLEISREAEEAMIREQDEAIRQMLAQPVIDTSEP
ncbi:MAG: hypothetical protein ACOYB2_11130 [Limnohabitans sp.]